MNGSILIALLLLAPPDSDARRGESSAQVAERALASARSSVAQADPQSARHQEAQAKLKEAEEHFRGARYEEAAQAADGVWKLLAERPSPPTKLSVMVDDKGGTTVKSVSGRVSVEANGVTRVVEDGASLQVEKGQAPRAMLAVPQSMRPADKQKLVQKALKTGLEPVVLSWQGVAGAERYEVELVPTRGDKRVLPATEPRLQVELAAGGYRWSVRAVAHDERSEASAAQDFEVAEAPTKPMNVKVKPPKWK